MTVAGRDGAGRLGEESEELSISLKGAVITTMFNIYILMIFTYLAIQIVTPAEPQFVQMWGVSGSYGIFLQWKVDCSIVLL